MADLFLLVQVIDAGSFSVAAGELGTTRSLLSRRIITLERRLGAQLLHRNARRFSVTPTGEAVYRHARAMCESAMAAEQAAARDDLRSQVVRVHAHSLLMPLMANVLPEFSALYPRMRVSLTPGAGDIEPLLRQQADIVLAVADGLPDSADIVARQLATVPVLTVAAPALIDRLKARRHPGAIPDDDVLAYAAAGAPKSLLLGPNRQQEARIVTSDAGVLLSSVRAGLGVARLPACLCEDDIRNGRLVAIRDVAGLDLDPIRVHALTMSARAVSEAALVFVRFLQERLGG